MFLMGVSKNSRATKDESDDILKLPNLTLYFSMKKKLRFSKKPLALFLTLAILSCFLFKTMIASAKTPPSIEVYVYGLSDSQEMEKIREFFSKLPDVKLVLCYINNSENLEELLKIVEILIYQGVLLLPSDVCIPCEMEYANWQEIYAGYSIPLALIFKNKSLTAITISSSDVNVLRQALAYSNTTTLKVFLSNGKVFSLDEKAKRKLEEFFMGEKRIFQTDLLRILPLIITAACVDAVNPCAFFVLVVFLSLVAMRLGRRATLKFGLAYSIAIFIIYFIMGIGIWRLISYIREARIFVVILGLSLGFRSILNFIFGFFGLSIGLRETFGGFLNQKFKRVPSFLSKRLAEHLRGFSNNPLSAFLIGVVTSAFLLPCTSGPYLIALSLIADLETRIQGILLLILYNSIIIVPFIAITLGIHMLKLETSKLKKWSSTRQRWLNLVGGLLMVALSVYLLIYSL